MNDRLLVFALVLLCVVGSGLIAGVFFAFSTFVMRALVRRPPAEGLAAMQAINVVVINPWFMTVFMGTAVLSLLAIVVGLARRGEAATAWMTAGGLLYLVGTFGVTALFNVPLNNAIAPLDPTATDARTRWANYVRRWTRWNHVRTAAGIAATVCFAIALGG